MERAVMSVHPSYPGGQWFEVYSVLVCCVTVNDDSFSSPSAGGRASLFGLFFTQLSFAKFQCLLRMQPTHSARAYIYFITGSIYPALPRI